MCSAEKRSRSANKIRALFTVRAEPPTSLFTVRARPSISLAAQKPALPCSPGPSHQSTPTRTTRTLAATRTDHVPWKNLLVKFLGPSVWYLLRLREKPRRRRCGRSILQYRALEPPHPEAAIPPENGRYAGHHGHGRKSGTPGHGSACRSTWPVPCAGVSMSGRADVCR